MSKAIMNTDVSVLEFSISFTPNFMGFFENAVYHCSVTKKHFAIRKPAHQKTDDT